MAVPLISLLLPTRGRPVLAKRFLDSVAQTTSRLERVEVIIYVDDDDLGSHGIASDRVSVTRIIGPARSMGEYNSICFAASRGKIIVLANDDMVIGTPGWDEKLLAFDGSIADHIYLAYGNDMLKGRRLSTFPILSRRTCEVLVEPYPVAYRGAFIDCHLFDIFKRIEHAGFPRIHYLDNVIFEHLHYRTGKAPMDDTYRRRDRFADDWTFLGLIDSRQRAAEQVLRVIRGDHSANYAPVRTPDPSRPANPLSAFVFFSRRLLLDLNLPVRWRTYLWIWFFGRYLAARGLLRPFVRV